MIVRSYEFLIFHGFWDVRKFSAVHCCVDQMPLLGTCEKQILWWLLSTKEKRRKKEKNEVLINKDLRRGGCQVLVDSNYFLDRCKHCLFFSKVRGSLLHCCIPISWYSPLQNNLRQSYWLFSWNSIGKFASCYHYTRIDET